MTPLCHQQFTQPDSRGSSESVHTFHQRERTVQQERDLLYDLLTKLTFAAQVWNMCVEVCRVYVPHSNAFIIIQQTKGDTVALS